MKPIFTLLFLIIYHAAFSQSGGKPEHTSTVPPVVQKPFPISGKYSQQIMANPSNADAWLDQYKWIGSNKEFSAAEKQQQSAQTIQLSRQYIAASWQFSLMNFIQSRKRNKAYLDAAMQQSADKATIYPYAIQFAIITNNIALLKEYATAFNEAAPLSPALQEYHYNVLMSAEKNATIYAKGLTDLAPMAVMQQVYGIRKDISFKYYEENIPDTANSYICLSSGKEIIQQYPAAGYAGLLVKISGNQNSEALQKLSSAFKLAELTKLQSLDENEKLIYQNYLPFFILLYRSYKINNDDTAEKWKALAEKTGRLTGTADSVNKILGE